MAKYEKGDIVTYWFVVVKEDDGSKRIQAYSDDKQLVKYYMDFHQYSKFQLKEMTGRIEDIVQILNENANDEIQIANIYTRDPEAKKGKNPMKFVSVPMTGTEIVLLRDDTAEFLNSVISYGYINECIPYMKDKWKKALQDIFLLDIIHRVVHKTETKKLSMLDVDQAMMLLRIPSAMFGL